MPVTAILYDCISVCAFAAAGRYPVYDGFPAQILDLQIRERNKILALSKEVTRRESVLTALQQKLAEVQYVCTVCTVCAVPLMLLLRKQQFPSFNQMSELMPFSPKSVNILLSHFYVKTY